MICLNEAHIHEWLRSNITRDSRMVGEVTRDNTVLFDRTMMPVIVDLRD